ncbi:MAG: hypothetical protein ACRC92_21635 [Peptostreptococcaceae bacterium]
MEEIVQLHDKSLENYERVLRAIKLSDELSDVLELEKYNVSMPTLNLDGRFNLIPVPVVCGLITRFCLVSIYTQEKYVISYDSIGVLNETGCDVPCWVVNNRNQKAHTFKESEELMRYILDVDDKA